jgi:hypothetical protein
MEIKDENPLLLDLVSFIINSEALSEDFKDGFCKGVSSLYKLVSSQIESDHMERDIRL